MDIAAVNGIPILGNQGRGTITEAVIKTLLRLQGPMQPHQIISLMTLGGPSFAMADHDDHIHVGYYPQGQSPQASKQFSELLKPDQWKRLIGRIAQIDNPTVPTRRRATRSRRQGQAEVQPVKRRPLRRLAWPAPR